MSCMAVSIHVRRPHGPRVARDGVRKKQLLDHDIIRLAGCVPLPPDSVPPHLVSHTMAWVLTRLIDLLIDYSLYRTLILVAN